MENQTVAIAPSPEQPVPPQKPKISLLTGMIALVLILLASTGYFAFQNYQLRKEISQLQSSPSPTPTPDPTANWKTYTDNQLRFSIKYPETFKVDYIQTQPYLDRKITWYTMDKQIDTYQGDGPVVKNKSTSNITNGALRFELEYRDIGGDKAHQSIMYQIPNPSSKTENDKYITFSLSPIPVLQTVEETNKYIKTKGYITLDSDSIKTFDQILSTFKFTE